MSEFYLMIRTAHPHDTHKVRDAFVKIQPPAVWGPEHEDALNTLRTHSWEVRVPKRIAARPPDRDLDEITIETIYQALLQVQHNSEIQVAELFRSYGIDRLGELPANRMADFYADLQSAWLAHMGEGDKD